MTPLHDALERLVHIIPMGYEIDRVVVPFQEFSAHRVHLISMADLPQYSDPAECAMTSKQHFYDEQVIEMLQKRGMIVQLHRIDMFDIISVMQTISKIILTEKYDGNRVYVNMSACGKIASVGATLAAMTHDVRLYYVRADRYAADLKEQMEHGISICSSPRLWQLENFMFTLPEESSLIVLGFLNLQHNEVSCNDIIRFLIENSISGFEIKFWELPYEEKRKCQTKYLVKLQNKILNKLHNEGYIERRKVGRNTMVKITKSGQYVTAVSSK